MTRPSTDAASTRSDPMLVGGRYRLTEQIRGGGMGTVWRGIDERLGRPVAVKILHGTLDGDATARERFRREAIAAGKVTHPAVAGVYDYVEEPDRRAIVMELVEGETLAARIAHGPLPPAEARRIFERVLAGLQAAHDCGVLHRDIKPSNILLTASGDVKVADFGVATITGESTLTLTGTIMATPQYAAPEQLRGGSSTPATDVYQTGVALYEALTGTLPFSGDTPVTVAMARLTQDPTPITVPDALAMSGVVMRALSREPADRFATAAQMRAALTGESPLPGRAVAVAPADGRGPTVQMNVADVATTTLATPPSANGPRHRLRGLAVRAALLALIIALAIAGLTAALSRSGSFELPALTNRSIADATAVAGRLGLDVKRQTKPRPGVAAGIVFAQEPRAGTSVERGATVTLIVADGCCTVPDLTTRDGAQAALSDARLALGRTTFRETSAVPAGTVLSQSPAPGTAVAPGTSVDIVVARAPAPPRQQAEPGDDDEDRGKGKAKRGRNDD